MRKTGGNHMKFRALLGVVVIESSHSKWMKLHPFNKHELQNKLALQTKSRELEKLKTFCSNDSINGTV